MSKRKSVHDYTGSVPVNGDVTPTTREPIENVDAMDWGDMNMNQLHEQRRILRTRLDAAGACGNQAIIDQITAGCRRLEALIKQRELEYEMRDDDHKLL